MTSTDRAPHRATRPPVPVPFEPRRVESSMARLASLLGGGRRAHLQSGSDLLTLTTLGLGASAPALPGALDAPGASSDGLRMETAAGVLVVAPAQALLRVLSHIDVPETGPLRRLLLDLALQGVPGGWLDLFGATAASLSRGDEAPARGATSLTFSLVLGDGGPRLPLTLHGTAETLLAALSRSGWASLPPARPVLSVDWSPRVPLRLGESLVGARALRELVPGDVLLIEQPTFDRHGRGRLPLGRRVALCELSLGNRLQCRFTNWADGPEHEDTSSPATEAHDPVSTPSSMTAMDADSDALRTDRPHAEAHTGGARTPGGGVHTAGGSMPAAGGHAYGATGAAQSLGNVPEGAGIDAAASSLDDLPVRLTFDLGALELSLGDVQALTPGTVLPLTAGVPPQVLVRCEGRLVGAGELVDVDGRLGVELTRLGVLA